MKGQASIELVGIIGIALLLATPFVVEAQDSMIDLAISSEDANFQTEINELGRTVDQVSKSGEKSQRTLEFQIPQNIDTIHEQPQALIFTQDHGDNRKNFSTSFNTEIQASNFPSDQGIYNLNIEYTDGKAVITQAGPRPEDFQITNVDFDESVEQGETFTANATVRNEGDEQGTQNIELDIFNGNPEYSDANTNQELDSGEQQLFEFEWGDTNDPGEYTFEINTFNDTYNEEFTILDEGEAFFEVDIDESESDGVVEQGETFNANYTVENTGDEMDTQNIEYAITQSQTEIDSGTDITNLQLDPSETEEGSFELDTSEENSGLYNLTISSENTTDRLEFEITESTEQFYWTAEDYSVGEEPNDAWEVGGAINSWNIESDSQGNHILMDGSNGDRSILSFTEADEAEDVEIFAKILPESGDDALISRATGRDNPDNDFTGYRFNADESIVETDLFNDGSYEGDISGSETSNAENTPFYIRARIEGDEIKVRTWDLGNSEPSNWDQEVTDSTISGEGETGIFQWDGEPRIYEFAVGINGEEAPGFDYLSQGNLVGHWDATEISANDGETVDTWFDISGQGNDAIQQADTAENEPILIENELNGNPVVEYAGRDENDDAYHRVGEVDGASEDWEIFIVGRTFTLGQTISYPIGIGTDDADEGQGIFFEFSSEDDSWGFFDADQVLTGSSSVQNEWGIFAVNNDNLNYTLYKDGEKENSAVGESAQISNMTLGGRSDGDFELDGQIAEAIVYNKSLDPSERAEIEVYLEDKWGLHDETDPANFQVVQNDTNSPMKEEETLEIDYEVENQGELEDTQTVSVEVIDQSDGSTLFQDSNSYTLNEGDSTGLQTFSFTTEIGDSGDYDYSLSTENDTVNGQIEIEEAFTDQGLVGHWDATQIQASDADLVSTWTDQSGEENDLTTSSSSDDPVYSDNVLNGNPVLDWSGSESMSADMDPLDLPVDVFVVAKSEAGSTTIIHDGYLGTETGDITFLEDDGDDVEDWRMFADTGFNIDAPSNPDDWNLLNSVYDGENSEWYVNGGLINQGDSGEDGTVNPFTLGSDRDESRNVEGGIAEVMFYDRKLDSDEREDVEEYLQEKWGLN